MKRTVALLLMALVLALGAVVARAEEEFEPFFRMDGDSPQAWEGELANLRLLTAGRYRFGKVKKKYGIDPGYVPDTRGLDRLNISGSAQFSEPQFRKLAQTLRECAGDSRVYIVDLRSESHGFLNGYPISWYGLHNWANRGMAEAAVRLDEAWRFGVLVGTTVQVYGVSHDQRAGEAKIEAQTWATEAELAEGEGFGYLRIPAADYAWPDADLIDVFIDFAKHIDMERSWLHFHCHAGVGRTGIFMMLYDKMKNPEVPMEDIIIRQTLTGSEYPLYSRNPNTFHGALRAEKARMMPLLFRYVEENHGDNYAMTWSRWLADQGA